jgi:hypothetical protein
VTIGREGLFHGGLTESPDSNGIRIINRLYDWRYMMGKAGFELMKMGYYKISGKDRGIAALCMLFCLILIGLPSNASSPGRILNQECQAVGRVNVTYSKLGIRILMQKTGCFCVAKPPNWEVIFYNPEKKLCFNAGRNAFDGSKFLPMIMGFQSGKFIHLAKVNSEKSNLQGLPAKHTFYTSSVPVDIPKNKSQKELAKARSEMLVRSAESWFVDDKRIPPEAASALRKFYLLPNPDGIPLKFTFVDAPGHTRSFIRTLQWEDIDCNEAMFEAPSNCKFAKKPEDVVLSSDLKDIIDSFGSL